VFQINHISKFEVKHLSKDNFDRALLNAIDEGLSSLGNSSREAVLHGFEASSQMKKEDIPLNLTEFRTALERIFGSGSRYLEEIITIRLCQKLGLGSEKLESNDLVFSAKELRRHFVSEGERRE